MLLKLLEESRKYLPSKCPFLGTETMNGKGLLSRIYGVRNTEMLHSLFNPIGCMLFKLYIHIFS